ncbi:MAG: TolC family protein [Pseudomonadota bacterium]
MRTALARGLAGAALLVLLASAVPAADPPKLSLESVLALADAPHPDMDQARARAQVAEAESRLAASLDDFRLTLEGTLRTGRNEFYNDHFHPDHQARLLARKNLYDGGLVELGTGAARAEAEARSLQTLDVQAQRRLTLMARYFDVLLAEMQYNADQEFLAVAYVDWDNNKDRLAQGQIAQWKLSELEARYQDARAKRNDTLRKLREKRLQLAHAMNRSESVAEELQDPPLADNNRKLPDFDVLLRHAIAHNPALKAQDSLLVATQGRRDAARSAYRPSVDFEAEAAYWKRESSTRDDVRAGLNFVLPLWQGDRVDANVAREQARITEIMAQRDKAVMQLRESMKAVWEEIQYLLDGERQRAQVNAQYRDIALEKARAEYEMELKTNLGTSMAETQVAQIGRRATEYRLALAWARLEALLGTPLADVNIKEAP